MNTTQHRPAARLAGLNPFYITAETPEPLPRVRDALCREFHKSGAEGDSGYGCVDWYQYRVIEESRLTNT